MEDQWFVDKRVLDIGCNDGSMDLILAARYSPSLLIGSDIDHKLTSKALKNMHAAINNQEQMALISQEMKKQKGESDIDEEESKHDEPVDSEYQAKVDDILSRIQNLPKSM